MTFTNTHRYRRPLAAMVFSLSALLLALPAFSATPGPDGNRGHLNRLLHSQAVIDHLGLSDDQAKAAQAVSNKTVEDHRAAFEKALAPQTKGERVPQVARVFVSVTAETLARLQSVIDPHQVQRLKQIEIQTFGFRVFNRAEVADFLGLSSEQREKLKSIGEASGERLGAVHKSKTSNAAEKSKAAAEIRGAAMRDVRQQLTALQWVKWELLTGAAFSR